MQIKSWSEGAAGPGFAGQNPSMLFAKCTWENVLEALAKYVFLDGSVDNLLTATSSPATALPGAAPVC